MPTEKNKLSSRPRGRQAVPETELKNSIADATLFLLLTEGYEATTVDAVAKHAGMAKKTLYRFADGRSDLIAQAIRSWTDSFRPVFEADPISKTDLVDLLTLGFKGIASQVLSSEAVGMFKLLQSEFEGREECLKIYQRNGIDRGRGILESWLKRQHANGFIQKANFAQLSDLLLSMVIAEPLRQMSLGLTAPLPLTDIDIDERIDAVVAFFKQAFLE